MVFQLKSHLHRVLHCVLRVPRDFLPGLPVAGRKAVRGEREAMGRGHWRGDFQMESWEQSSIIGLV
jgi:hypothetical protein